MAQQQNTAVLESLASTFSRAAVEAEAKRLGVVKRQRKVDIFALVATLVFGFHAVTQRTLAALRQVFEKVTGVHLVPSAFYDRLTENLAKLLHLLKGGPRGGRPPPGDGGIGNPLRDRRSLPQ